MDPKKSQDDVNIDDILTGFEQTPLNLTNGDSDGDDSPEELRKVKQEYEAFMKSLGQGQGEEGMPNNIQGLLGNLMKELSGEMGSDGSDLTKMLEGLMKGGGEGNDEDFSKVAEQALNQLLTKDLLYEPIKEAKAAYSNFFQKEGSKYPAAQIERYKKQQVCIQSILEMLDKQPENKAGLSSLFESIQQMGPPPPGIVAPNMF